MKKLVCVVLYLLAFAVLLSSNVLAQYQARELPVLSGHVRSQAYGFNDAGWIVGLSIDPDNHYHFALWDPEGNVAPVIDNATWSINNLGQLAGSDYYSNQVTLWNADGSVAASYDQGDVDRVNNFGAIAGTEYTSTRAGMCYWDSNGLKWDINLLEGYQSGYIADLNNKGQVVGVCQNADGASRGFMWTVDGGTVDLGVLTGMANFQPFGLNDDGVLVGNNRQDGYGAALWDPRSGAVDLHAQAGGEGWTYAKDINNKGQIVGLCRNKAALWNPDGSVTILDELEGSTLSEALFINESGAIAGWSNSSEHEGRIVVWNPVPEPSSMFALVSGLVGLGWSSRRLRKR